MHGTSETREDSRLKAESRKLRTQNPELRTQNFRSRPDISAPTSVACLELDPATTLPSRHVASHPCRQDSGCGDETLSTHDAPLGPLRLVESLVEPHGRSLHEFESPPGHRGPSHLCWPTFRGPLPPCPTSPKSALRSPPVR